LPGVLQKEAFLYRENEYPNLHIFLFSYFKIGFCFFRLLCGVRSFVDIPVKYMAVEISKQIEAPADAEVQRQ
jgi:hypothetical protein